LVKDLNDAVIDTNGHTLTDSGTIAPAATGGTGGVVKNGTGSLVLQGTNSYVGATTVNAGTLSISSNANLGDQTAGAAVNLNGGSTLAATATTALDNAGANARNVNIGTGGASIDVADQTTLTVNGVVSGPGTLNTPNRFLWTGPVSGGGTLNVGVTTTISRLDLSNDFSAFTGNLNFTGSGSVRLLRNGGNFNTAGLASTTVNLGDSVFLA